MTRQDEIKMLATLKEMQAAGRTVVTLDLSDAIELVEQVLSDDMLEDMTIDRDGCAYQRDQLQAENAHLRQIISGCATACGAAVSPECTLEFMEQLPGEVASVCRRLTSAVIAQTTRSFVGQHDQRDIDDLVTAGIRAQNAKVKALYRVAVELRGAVTCESMGHREGEFHAHDEPCPVLERFDAALSAGEWV